MCDQTKIEHELASISRLVGDIRSYSAWSKVISINLQQMGAARLADLTVAQLLDIIAEAEQALGGQVQHAN